MTSEPRRVSIARHRSRGFSDEHGEGDLVCRVAWLSQIVGALLEPRNAGLALDQRDLMPPSEPLERVLLQGLWAEFQLRGTTGIAAILQPVADRLSMAGSVRPTRTAPFAPTVSTAIDLITCRIRAEDLDIEEVVSQMGVSRRTLSRLFRASVGTTLHRYVHGLRIQFARELLGRTELSAKEIAARVGYRRTSDLDLHFRKACGLTPMAYRRQARTQLLPGTAMDNCPDATRLHLTPCDPSTKE